MVIDLGMYYHIVDIILINPCLGRPGAKLIVAFGGGQAIRYNGIAPLQQSGRNQRAADPRIIHNPANPENHAIRSYSIINPESG